MDGLDSTWSWDFCRVLVFGLERPGVVIESILGLLFKGTVS